MVPCVGGGGGGETTASSGPCSTGGGDRFPSDQYCVLSTGKGRVLTADNCRRLVGSRPAGCALTTRPSHHVPCPMPCRPSSSHPTPIPPAAARPPGRRTAWPCWAPHRTARRMSTASHAEGRGSAVLCCARIRCWHGTARRGTRWAPHRTARTARELAEGEGERGVLGCNALRRAVLPSHARRQGGAGGGTCR